MKSTCNMLIVLGFIALLVSFTACSEDEITKVEENGGDGPATLENRIENNNDFAFKLYRQLKDSDDNLIVSPHSISTCFGMAYAGARGNTESEIADVLCFNYPQAGFHTVLEALNDELNSRADIDLRIANGSWGREEFIYLQAYLDTLAACYDATTDYLDFAGDPEGSRQIINQWVEDHTDGLITELLPYGCIDQNTYLVLANTVYFLAEWLHQFEPAMTIELPFTRLDDSQVDVDYMRGEEVMPHFVGDGFQAMAMPYKGEQVSMIMLLPDEGSYGAFENNLTAAGLDTIVDNLSNTYMTFNIPKFEFYSDFNLNETLQDMGIVDAFEPGAADFSGMDGTVDGAPWIDMVVHKAYITIDEYGTMAAAGTGMMMTLGSWPSFRAERPFIFVIRDNPTGTILFMGRVLDPSAL
jgi:serpin B